MTIALTAYLDAVNMVLSAAGEMPVAGYTSTYGADAVLADQILSETSRSIQSIGWYFNTRKGPIVLSPSAGVIATTGMLRIEFYNYDDSQGYAIRNNKLWDLVVNDDDQFTEDLTVKSIVYLLEWADLPEAARQAIAKKAARIFVDRHLSDPNVSRMARQDEAEAMALLQREDIATSNSRVFGPQMSWLVDRPSPLTGLTSWN